MPEGVGTPHNGKKGGSVKQTRAFTLIFHALPRHLVGVANLTSTRARLDVQSSRMHMPRPGLTTMRVLPLGDASILIELGYAIDEATHARVRAAFDALCAAAIPGLVDIVPAYTGVAVHYDPLQFTHAAGAIGDAAPYDSVRRAVIIALDAAGADAGRVDIGRTIEIPVRYGGEYGPDLDHVAEHARMTAAEVVALHAGAEYTVYMIGFTPGFPYLGGLPDRLATPRRASPRQAVPAGSVGIAGSQTGVYPLRTPGGWQIIGRTEERLFRPELDPPTLLRIGDRVHFVDVSDA